MHATETQIDVQIDDIIEANRVIHSGHLQGGRAALIDYAEGRSGASPAVVASNVRFVSDSVKQVYGTSFGDGWKREDYLSAFTSPRADLIAAVERARAIISTEIEPPPVTRRRVRRGVECGESIDGDRFLARIPEMWDRCERTSSPRRLVRIAVNLATHWDCKQKDIVWRGATAVALADELTRQGFDVEVIAFRAVQGFLRSDSGTHISACVVKRSTDPIDLAALSVICCSVAFYRQAFVLAAALLAKGEVDSSRGGPVEVGRDAVGADVVLGCGIRNEGDARKAIEEMLESLKAE